MGKHDNGYPRIPRDYYPTPPWVVGALLEHIDVAGLHVLEPACGDGRMAEALKAGGARVHAMDVEDHGYSGLAGLCDFTAPAKLTGSFDGIVTNPPFGPRSKLAEAFIEAGLRRMGTGFLALLLPADFDSAKTRAHLFGCCPQFTGKIALTRRIKWFEHPDKPNRQPKENSAWFLWGNAGLQDRRIPVIRYAPKPDDVTIAARAGSREREAA
jgi:hypothetical protein